MIVHKRVLNKTTAESLAYIKPPPACETIPIKQRSRRQERRDCSTEEVKRFVKGLTRRKLS